MRVLIVGGGPAGLTLADRLQHSHRVTLVEAGARWGGMAASIDVDGVRCDLGSHRLHPVASEPVEAMLRDLLGDDLQVRERNGRILIADRWVRFPLAPVDLMRHLPPRFSLRVGLDALAGPVRRRGATPPASDTFDAVVRAGLGPAVLDWFYGPYAEKLWGRPGTELSGELARRRISANSPGKIIAKLAGAARGHRPVFRYPSRGYGQVVDALVERCVDADLRLGWRVEALDGTTATLTDGERHDHEPFDRVFWTAPAGTLADVVEAAGGRAPTFRPSVRAMVCAYLVYEGGPVTGFDAHYLPHPDVLAARVSEPINYRDGDDPTGRTVLCAEVVCDRGDATWVAEPDALGARIADDLNRLGVTDRRPVRVAVERLPSVYPVIGVGEETPLAELRTWSHGLDGVTVLGRQGLVVADNLHHVFDMALTAAAIYDDGVWDQPAWEAALARFDGHIVED